MSVFSIPSTQRSKMAKNAVKQEVVAHEMQSGELAIPSWMAGDAGMGLEGVDQSLLTIPRISLMHSTSDPVTSGLTAPGHYWHKTLQESVGTKVIAIPVFVEKSYLLWDPAPGAREVLARGVKKGDIWIWDPSNTTFDVIIDKKGTKAKWNTSHSIAASGLAKWDDNTPPPAKEVINVLFALPEVGPDSFGVMSFMKSAYPIGRQLVQTLHAKSRLPTFAYKFVLGSHTVTAKSKEKHLAPTIQPAGMVEDEVTYNACKAMCERVRATGLSGVPVEGDDAPGDGSASSSADEKAF